MYMTWPELESSKMADNWKTWCIIIVIVSGWPVSVLVCGIANYIIVYIHTLNQCTLGIDEPVWVYQSPNGCG